MDLRIPTTSRTLALVASVTLALALLVGGWSPSPVAAAVSGPASLHGTGTWLNEGICAPIPPSPGAAIACTGRTIWNGPLLTGTTTYTAAGGFTPAGDIVGTVDETFTGRAATGAQGTIHFTESLSLTMTGAVFIVADAVGGTGDFCHVTGHLVFTGTADVSGIGSGTYAGHIVTPKNCG